GDGVGGAGQHPGVEVGGVGHGAPPRPPQHGSAASLTTAEGLKPRNTRKDTEQRRKQRIRARRLRFAGRRPAKRKPSAFPPFPVFVPSPSVCSVVSFFFTPWPATRRRSPCHCARSSSGWRRQGATRPPCGPARAPSAR